MASGLEIMTNPMEPIKDRRTKTGKLINGNKNSGTALRSQAEIGAIFGVSLQSIQSVEYRALKKIRRAIQREADAAGKSVRDWLFGDD